MAVRNIRKEGDPVLRKKSRAVERIDDRIGMLLDDMNETMKLAEGVGLAAPQVGVLKRVIIVDIGEGPIELINPQIMDTEGSKVEEEGCLSIPGKSGKVRRPYRVKVRGLDRTGKDIEVEGEGLLARALCHEIDHLDGILFVDRVIEDEGR
ncbi:MAG: Peptide deformylase [Firmicutes bacterium]|nr:Peptide deformylase [Bacillota bacterium]MDI6705472.1 peptide deformylase [Bacillota bacterium]